MSKPKRKLELKFFTRGFLRTTLNTANWKTHPQPQLDAIRESVNKHGWAKPLVFNAHTGRLLNGHGRVTMPGDEDEIIPTLVGSWPPEDERYILATFDPLGMQAETYNEQMAELLEATLQTIDRSGSQDGTLELLNDICDRYALEANRAIFEQAASRRKQAAAQAKRATSKPHKRNVVELFYDEAEHAEFREHVAALAQAWGIDPANTDANGQMADVLLKAARQAIKAAA